MRGLRPVTAAALRLCAGVALLTLAGCNTPGSGGTPQTAPDATATVAPAASTAPMPAAGDPPVSNAERARAGQLVQRIYAQTHGLVTVHDIAVESGVFHMKVVTHEQPQQRIDVYLSRDLRILFPTGIDTAQRLQDAAADRNYNDCLKAKGLHLYGDPRQPQTQRQLAELGVAGRALLVDCAANPNDCRLVKEAPLPMLMFGTKQISSFVPRNIISQWTGCP